jgi:hypothetical protein
MPSNVGSALNYGNDYRRYKVSQYYQTLNAIALSGPAPMTTYGPGGWAQIFSPTFYLTTGTSTTSPTYTTNATMLISSGTQGINQNLPGSSVYLSSSGTPLFSQAGLQLNLQLSLTDTKKETIAQISFYLTLSNPANCVWNPNNAISALAITGAANTTTSAFSTSQYPPYSTAYSTVSASGIPVGASINVSTSTGNTTTAYSDTMTISRLTSTEIATLLSGSSTPVLPQLNTNNAAVFLVTMEFTNFTLTPNASYPVIINVPLTAYYNVPDINIYS